MSETKLPVNQTNVASALRAGDIKIKHVKLIDRDGTVVDISKMMLEFNIFGDLFTPFQTATIVMADNVGLLSLGGIHGEETIVISMQSSSRVDYIKSDFTRAYRVVAIENVKRSDEYTLSYNLQLISFMGYQNSLIHLKRKYKGLCGDVAKEIYDENLRTPWLNYDGVETKELWTNDEYLPINRTEFIPASWTPAKTMQWVGQRSYGLRINRPGDTAPLYLFNEGFDQPFFANLDTLVHIGKIKASEQETNNWLYRLFYAPSTVDTSTSQAYQTIINMEIKDSHNQMKLAKSGYGASRLNTLDVVSKKYQTHYYDFIRRQDEFNLLENHVPGDKLSIQPTDKHVLYNSRNFPRSYDSKAINIVKHNELFFNFPSYEFDKWLQPSMSLLAGLGAFTVNATIYGRFDIQPGTVLFLGIPHNIEGGGESKLLSGYYLVTSTRHVITHKRHYTHIECVKDSTQAYE